MTLAVKTIDAGGAELSFPLSLQEIGGAGFTGTLDGPPGVSR